MSVLDLQYTLNKRGEAQSSVVGFDTVKLDFNQLKHAVNSLSSPNSIVLTPVLKRESDVEPVDGRSFFDFDVEYLPHDTNCRVFAHPERIVRLDKYQGVTRVSPEINAVTMSTKALLQWLDNWTLNHCQINIYTTPLDS